MELNHAIATQLAVAVQAVASTAADLAQVSHNLDQSMASFQLGKTPMKALAVGASNEDVELF